MEFLDYFSKTSFCQPFLQTVMMLLSEVMQER
jgi:hypothetical protein